MTLELDGKVVADKTFNVSNEAPDTQVKKRFAHI